MMKLAWAMIFTALSVWQNIMRVYNSCMPIKFSHFIDLFKNLYYIMLYNSKKIPILKDLYHNILCELYNVLKVCSYYIKNSLKLNTINITIKLQNFIQV